MAVKEEEKKWYILWSPTDCKLSKVEDVLLNTGAEFWMPCFKQVNGQDEDIVPLYPSYYFIKCDDITLDNVEERISCLKARGKIQVMRDENKRAYTLSEDEVERVRQAEREEVNSATITEEESVRVNNGTLNGCLGKVVEVKKGFLKIATTMFNRELDAIWVPEGDCERVG